jgi:hypothetical protein
MRFINVSEGEKTGDLALNMEQIKYARHLVGGVLDLYFEGGSDQSHLTLKGPAAAEVWREIIKIH